MSFNAQFRSLMADTIQLAAPTGRNAQGTPTYAGATDKSYRCRISGPTQSLRRSGSELNSPLYTIWVDSGDEVITPEYRLTMPSSSVWGTSTPLIFAVHRVTDEDGQHHTKITLGFMYHRQGQT